MQVISDNLSSATRIADYPALPNGLAGHDAEDRAVCIQNFPSIAVVKNDMVAIAAASRIDGIRNGDCSVRRCEDWHLQLNGDIGVDTGIDFASS